MVAERTLSVHAARRTNPWKQYPKPSSEEQISLLVQGVIPKARAFTSGPTACPEPSRGGSRVEHFELIRAAPSLLPTAVTGHAGSFASEEQIWPPLKDVIPKARAFTSGPRACPEPSRGGSRVEHFELIRAAPSLLPTAVTGHAGSFASEEQIWPPLKDVIPKARAFTSGPRACPEPSRGGSRVEHFELIRAAPSLLPTAVTGHAGSFASEEQIWPPLKDVIPKARAFTSGPRACPEPSRGGSRGEHFELIRASPPLSPP